MQPQEKLKEFSLSELGHIGLPIFSGVTSSELQNDLNFPNSIKTFKKMQYHSSISSALQLFSLIVSKARWKFIPPERATKKEIKQTKSMNEMMHDMDHTWSDFITEVMSTQLFGFCINEKVYRYRKPQNGSKYNDNIIGWKKLPIRTQETIDKFIMDTQGKEVMGVQQSPGKSTMGYYTGSDINIKLPKEKYLHFKTGRHRGDPFGKSPLIDAYTSWKYITVLEELEAVGVNKDLVGLPVFKIPAKYLSSEASASEKATRAYYENAGRNLHMNRQSSVLLPSDTDPDSKAELFKLELLSIDGKKGYDVTKIKQYYLNQIYTALMADLLIMGQSNTGSFALAEFKNSVTSAQAENMASMICDVINKDLVKQTYELNGWDFSRACTLDYDGLENFDLESLSKYVQRIASVGLFEVDRPLLNLVRESVGLDARPEDEEPRKELMNDPSSKSGEGFKTPGDGTAKSPSSRDNSQANLENS
jgi:hypothetical protein